MPLFEIGGAHQLVGFRQLSGGADLYESEIEDLLWHNFEELTGETLFLVARQAVIAGGRPDMVALDHDARVVVIEIKRDVDRGQLAQCLEYAGWARTTNLDELAGMYHGGESDFFTNWQDFTGSDTPVRIRRSTRLILVAREFHGRTGSAFEFLIENNLPVKLIRVSIYQDPQGRRVVDIEGEHEPEFPAAGAGEGGTQVEDPTKIEGRRVRLTDLVDAGVLRPGQNLIWDRPQVGANYRATVTDEGSLRLQDGRALLPLRVLQLRPPGAVHTTAGTPGEQMMGDANRYTNSAYAAFGRSSATRTKNRMAARRDPRPSQPGARTPGRWRQVILVFPSLSQTATAPVRHSAALS
jgi:Restriction Enzyme Adenine Methylase Associated